MKPVTNTVPADRIAELGEQIMPSPYKYRHVVVPPSVRKLKYDTFMPKFRLGPFVITPPNVIVTMEV